MAYSNTGKLVVAVSSRALFDLEEENRVFDAEGAASYMQHQLANMDKPAQPGAVFELVRKILALNTPDRELVDVVVVSRNDPVSGMRVFNSAASYGITIERGVFTQGRARLPYLRPLGAQLFLSANSTEVREALQQGFAAACVLPTQRRAEDEHPNELRIAFDGDSVLFSDEAERVVQEHGLLAFRKHESEKAETPLPPGPLKPFLSALATLQQKLRQTDAEHPMNLRIALVTARGAPSHERAIRTLMSWGIFVDEAMFLGGLPKAEFLREFGADFFFDDSIGNVLGAAERDVPSGHVASGVLNE
ncbi:MAG: 5'-nucleotidase [Actinomycetaceae bacterium]|nr:5'-nucleotidase [Actinomycetaceae bacterium]